MKSNKTKSSESLLQDVLIKFKPLNKKDYKYRFDGSFVSKFDWHYNGTIEKVVYFDYDIYYENCSEERCGYTHSCAKIGNFTIKKIDISAFIKVLTKDINDEVLINCIDRIIKLAKLDQNCFEMIPYNGFYGEEIDSIHLKDDVNLFIFNNLCKLIGLSDEDKIKTVLSLENQNI